MSDNINEIIEKEGLGVSITDYILFKVGKLVDLGYSEEDAEKAVAGALPYLVFRHAQLR